MSERLDGIMERHHAANLANLAVEVTPSVKFKAAIAASLRDIAAMAPVVAAALKRRDARRALTEWWRVNDPDKDGLACIASEAELDAVEDALYEAQEAEDAACDAFDSAQPADPAHAERLRLERAVVEAACAVRSISAAYDGFCRASARTSPPAHRYEVFENYADAEYQAKVRLDAATDALLAFEAQGGPTQ